VTERFDAKMKSVLPPKDLQAAWDAVAREAGPFQEQLAARTEQFGVYKIVFVTARFQEGPVDVKVVFDKTGRISGLFLVPTPVAPNGSASTRPAAVSFSDEDLKVVPYKEGGLFQAIAAVHNSCAQPSAQYEVRFYRGHPERGNEAGPPFAGGVGPIEPNGTWREASLPFALRDGTHAITAVLTPARSEETAAGLRAGSEKIAAGLRATVVVTVRDGMIVSQTPGAGGTEQSTAAVPFRHENLTIEPYEEGGLFIVRVKLRNSDDSVTPRCTLRYFRGDPRNAVPAGPVAVTNIDPMQPGGKSDSGSPPFALTEGSNVISAVLRPVNAPPTAPSQIVSVRVTIKDGKIVSQQPADTPATQSSDARGQSEPSEARSMTNEAQNLFERKDYDRAMAVFLQVVDKHPRSALAENAQMMIGVCYGHLGQNEKAIAAFERAIREYPHTDLAATYFYLGSAYERAERFDDALAAYEQSLQRGERIGRSGVFPGKNAAARIESLKTRTNAGE
jgi:hypothetical protein